MANMTWASPVDSTEARNLAQTFWNLTFPDQAKPNFEEISLNAGVENFYIFNNVNGPGFVMVSGDDCAVPILGYSGANNCVGGELPDNVRYWLDFYDNTIGTAVQNGEVATEEIASQWASLRAGRLPEPKSITAVSPLIATTWDQTAPFNNLCPGTGNTKAAVGCVATAMAQVMKYHNWPTTGTGSYSYYCYNGTYDYGILSANFGATTYNWNNMLNSYPNANSGTTAQQNAVATLMYHCGISVQMSYSPEWSGAFLSDVEIANSAYPNYPTTEKALKNYFNYSPSLTGLAKANYSSTQWTSMLKSELDNARPVLYDGTDQSGQGGHCFVCDGYNNSNNFHFNWGWRGWYDGYFVLTSLTPGPGGTGAGNSDYSYNQTALFGVTPNNGSNPPATNNDLHVYSDYTYSPNPLQQNQTVTVDVNAANAGSSTFTGTIKLALLTANNTEAQVIGELSGSINSMTYAQLQYSGTVTVPAGTYQMALLSQATGESTWSLLGSSFGYANPITVTVAGGSTPPGPSGCAYLHYPLPGTPTVYTAEGGGYVSGSNVYGDEAKADYFTYSGTGTIDRIKITVGAMDGTQGSVVFKIWADNNGVPGAVLGSKTVTLSEINNNMNANNEYECVLNTPVTVNGNFFAGLDVTNATSYFGLATTTNGTSANTGWEYYDNDWWTYTETWEMNLTNAIFPYVCSGTDPNPPVSNTDLHVYSDFTYTPNPMQQNQSVSVEVNVANAGSSAYTGTLKLVLLNSGNVEAQVIGQSNISLNPSSYFNFRFSGTVTVPAGTYQMAVYAQANGTSTWTLVGNNFGYANPVSVTVIGGSNPPANDYHLVMYEAFSYTPNPLQQNQSVTVNASVGNTGNSAFNGSFKLVLLNSNNFEAQTIGQTSLSNPITSMQYAPLTFSGTVTAMPGTYQMALYYQANGESTWTLVGNDLGVSNPVSVTVAGGSTPPVNDVDLNMYADFMYMPDPIKQNAVVYVSANVINMGNTAFTGSLRLALETFNDEFVQTIQQISVSTPIAPNGHTAFNFNGTVTATPGFYNLILYYKPDGASNWTVVGNNYNSSFQNPKSVIVTNPDGIDDHTLDAVRLRPNPAKDHFYIDVPDQNIDGIEIVNSTGQVVHTQKNLTGSESIDISFLRSGVYFVRYETSGRVGIQKLVVR